MSSVLSSCKGQGKRTRRRRRRGVRETAGRDGSELEKHHLAFFSPHLFTLSLTITLAFSFSWCVCFCQLLYAQYPINPSRSILFTSYVICFGCFFPHGNFDIVSVTKCLLFLKQFTDKAQLLITSLRTPDIV